METLGSPNEYDRDVTRLTFDERTDVCTVCSLPYKWNRRKMIFPTTPEGLCEVIFVTSHAGCRALQDKLQKAKEETLNLEFELFCKRFSAVKYN